MTEHYTPLLSLLVASFGLAFLLGYLAHRLHLSPIVGYLLAGVLIGPSTPGYMADPSLASELAEVGVILLMFGVGLHFSLKDLSSVKRIAIPGAIVQMIIATLLGTLFSFAIGWSFTTGLMFGFALSIASTVVLIRALEERHLLKTLNGKIAIGWLIVEDLAVVIILVFLPPIAAIAHHPTVDQCINTYPGHNLFIIFLITIVKATTFIALMLVFCQRFIPKLLFYVAYHGSQELFRLGVLAVAMVVAFIAAKLFGLSLALGAFFAGMILNASTLRARVATETLALRETFAVLFFVAIGMLVRPETLIEHPGLVLMTALIILLGKSLAAFMIVLAFRYPVYTALTISASLAQIGEFSFILAAIGHQLGMLPVQAKDLILAGAFISILLNPLLFSALTILQPTIKSYRKKQPG